MEPAQTDHASGFDGQQSKSCKPLLHRVDLMVVYQKAWYRRIQLAHIFACTGRRSLIQRHLASSEPMDTIRQHNTPIRKDAQVQDTTLLQTCVRQLSCSAPCTILPTLWPRAGWTWRSTVAILCSRRLSFSTASKTLHLAHITRSSLLLKSKLACPFHISAPCPVAVALPALPGQIPTDIARFQGKLDLTQTEPGS